MIGSRASVACEGVRAQLSLQLDDELSQLERRMLAGHLSRCTECREYAADVSGFTELLRSAPLERLERPLVLERPRRLAAAQLQLGAAAALAFVALGIGSLLASGLTFSGSAGAATHFQTRADLENELDIIELVSERYPSASHDALL